MKPELVDCIAGLRDDGVDLRTVADQMLYVGYSGRIQFAIMNPNAFPHTAQSAPLVGVIKLCKLISDYGEYLRVIEALRGDVAVTAPDCAVGRAVSLPDKDTEYVVSDVYLGPDGTSLNVALRSRGPDDVPVVRLPLETFRGIAHASHVEKEDTP